MRSKADVPSEGCGSVALTVGLAIFAAVVPWLVLGGFSYGEWGGDLYNWKGTFAEGLVLGYVAGGVLVGLVAGNLLCKWRWAVGVPLIVGLFVVPVGCLQMVGSAFSHGSTRPTPRGYVCAALLAAIGLGLAMVYVLSLARSASGRAAITGVALAVMVSVGGFCQVRGATYLSRLDRDAMQPVVEWLNADVLARGESVMSSGFHWSRVVEGRVGAFKPGERSEAVSESHIGGIRCDLTLLPPRWERSLEGVNARVLLWLPGGEIRGADLAVPGGMLQVLCQLGLKPELAARFVPVGGTTDWVAQYNGFAWTLSGAPNLTQTTYALTVSTWVVWSAAGLKPGTPQSP